MRREAQLARRNGDDEFRIGFLLIMIAGQRAEKA
jgi:hypothetical protein